MDLAHETMLSDFLLDVWETGTGRIEKRLLLRWYGYQKLTLNVWRNIHQRFQAILNEAGEKPDDWQLFVHEHETDGTVVFACLDLGDIQKGEGWWQPVDSHAEGARDSKKKKAEPAG